MKRLVAVVAALTSLALAACSSSGSSGSPSTSTASSPSSTSSSPSTASTSTSSSTSAASAATDALVARLKSALATVTSAHIVTRSNLLGGLTTADVKIANGTTVASRTTTTVAQAQYEVIMVGSTTWAKLPSGTAGKPWVVVTPDSKNEFVRALASQLQVTGAASSLQTLAEFSTAATSVTGSGDTYRLVLDPARVASGTLGKLLQATGQTEIPVTITLDSAGRPSKIVLISKVGGRAFTVTVDITRYNAPVSISAPPSSQIAS